MQDNFEHFNWEDLFKDYSKDPQETAILNLPELDSLTNEECTTVVVSSVMKTLPKTPCKQASQRYELQTSLPNEDRQNTEDMRDIGTMMMTQQESSSELPDIFGHETFFDDVIKDTFNTSGDLTGCYGDGRVWKEEEVDAASWKEVSAILEQNGGFHKDKKLKVEDEDWTFMDAPSNQDNGETLKDGGNGLLFNSVDFNNDTNASDGNKVGVFEEVPYLWVVNDNQTEGCNNIVNIVTNNKNVTPSNFKSVHFASDLVSNKFCNDRNLSFSSEKDTNSKIKKGLKRKIQLKTKKRRSDDADDDDDDDDDDQTRLEYLEKRFKNNQSVRKCREKSRKRQQDVQKRMRDLEEENEGLRRKVDEMEKEVDILKRLLMEVVRK